ncbi:MAG: hypothetical protein CW338_10845 [Clostridiales bacterium]|nr:hypothetical protein [Clostridiales bacterium]
MKRIRDIIKTKYGKVILCLAAVLCIALIVTGVLHISGRAERKRMAEARTERLNEAAEGLDSYDLDLIIRPGDGTVALTEEITFTNRTGETLDEIILRTWPGAFSREETSPAAIEEVYGDTYGAAFSAGGIRVDGTWVDGRIAGNHFEDDACTVLSIACGAIAPQQSVKVLLRVSLTVPECAYRYGRCGDIWQLGNIIPLIAVRENGDWVRDEYYPVGDPFRSECANFTVKVTLPEEYTLLCSAPMTRNGNVWTGTMPAARDIALIAGKGLVTEEKDVNGIRVISAAGKADKKAAETALDLAADALETYEKLYGPYPYTALTLARCDLPFEGMAYPGLIMLSGNSYFREETLEITVARQVAQQWFSVLAGTDSYTHPWQDEALSEYAMLSYMRDQHGEDRRQRVIEERVDASLQENISSPVTPGSPIEYFTYLTDYTSVVYDRGCAALLAADLMTGGRIDAFLRRYCEVFAFRTASRDDFETLLNEFAGMDLRPLMTDYLDTLS